MVIFQPLGKLSESGHLAYSYRWADVAETLHKIWSWHLGLTVHQLRHQQPIGNPWLCILLLICLVAFGDTLTQRGEVMAPSGMLYVCLWSRKAVAWHCSASSFREKDRGSTNSFACSPRHLYHTLEEFRDLLAFGCCHHYYIHFIYYGIKRKLDNLVCLWILRYDSHNVLYHHYLLVFRTYFLII